MVEWSEDDSFFLAQDVYDYLFENEQNIGTNFLEAFPESYIDCESSVIYLAIDGEKPLFKVTIERL